VSSHHLRTIRDSHFYISVIILYSTFGNRVLASPAHHSQQVYLHFYCHLTQYIWKSCPRIIFSPFSFVLITAILHSTPSRVRASPPHHSQQSYLHFYGNCTQYIWNSCPRIIFSPVSTVIIIATPHNTPSRVLASSHHHSQYGVAMISRLLQIIGLFCKRAL